MLDKFITDVFQHSNTVQFPNDFRASASHLSCKQWLTGLLFMEANRQHHQQTSALTVNGFTIWCLNSLHKHWHHRTCSSFVLADTMNLQSTAKRTRDFFEMIVRYTNWRFTYLLTYLLQHTQWHQDQLWTWPMLNTFHSRHLHLISSAPSVRCKYLTVKFWM